MTVEPIFTFVPALLNLFIKTFQTGHEIAAAPTAAKELLETISQARSDIDAAKSKRTLLAKVNTDAELAEFDKTIEDVESALKSLEKVVEPARASMDLNEGQISAWTRLMWVVRDSNKVLASSSRLMMAQLRFERQVIISTLTHVVRDAVNGAQEVKGTHLKDDASVPPPYLVDLNPLQESMHERRELTRKYTKKHAPNILGDDEESTTANPSHPAFNMSEAFVALDDDGTSSAFTTWLSPNTSQSEEMQSTLFDPGQIPQMQRSGGLHSRPRSQISATLSPDRYQNSSKKSSRSASPASLSHQMPSPKHMTDMNSSNGISELLINSSDDIRSTSHCRTNSRPRVVSQVPEDLVNPKPISKESNPVDNDINATKIKSSMSICAKQPAFFSGECDSTSDIPDVSASTKKSATRKEAADRQRETPHDQKVSSSKSFVKVPSRTSSSRNSESRYVPIQSTTITGTQSSFAGHKNPISVRWQTPAEEDNLASPTRTDRSFSFKTSKTSFELKSDHNSPNFETLLSPQQSNDSSTTSLGTSLSPKQTNTSDSSLSLPLSPQMSAKSGSSADNSTTNLGLGLGLRKKQSRPLRIPIEHRMPVATRTNKSSSTLNLLHDRRRDEWATDELDREVGYNK